jgi:hypothetical protein
MTVVAFTVAGSEVEMSFSSLGESARETAVAVMSLQELARLAADMPSILAAAREEVGE